MPHEFSPTNVRTRLAAARVRAGYTQADMASRTGIALPTYRRLERGIIPKEEAPNPPLRLLVNCGIVLDVPWQELVEPSWEEWLDLGVKQPSANDIEFWKSVAYMWPDPDEGSGDW